MAIRVEDASILQGKLEGEAGEQWCMFVQHEGQGQRQARQRRQRGSSSTSVSRRILCSVSSISAASLGYELMSASRTKPPFAGFAAVAKHSDASRTSRDLMATAARADGHAQAMRDVQTQGAMHTSSRVMCGFA